jgi:hypothetical protein
VCYKKIPWCEHLEKLNFGESDDYTLEPLQKVNVMFGLFDDEYFVAHERSVLLQFSSSDGEQGNQFFQNEDARKTKEDSASSIRFHPKLRLVYRM